ncbi:hypothetical protein, partial [Methylobacterium nigriterrae]|uniref:hypothetical protein n=1 Tax=Methylobacterium nigriterrae TaxID=3127512 RepID=UPI003D6748FD
VGHDDQSFRPSFETFNDNDRHIVLGIVSQSMRDACLLVALSGFCHSTFSVHAPDLLLALQTILVADILYKTWNSTAVNHALAGLSQSFLGY